MSKKFLTLDNLSDLLKNTDDFRTLRDVILDLIENEHDKYEKLKLKYYDLDYLIENLEKHELRELLNELETTDLIALLDETGGEKRKYINQLIRKNKKNEMKTIKSAGAKKGLFAVQKKLCLIAEKMMKSHQIKSLPPHCFFEFDCIDDVSNCQGGRSLLLRKGQSLDTEPVVLFYSPGYAGKKILVAFRRNGEIIDEFPLTLDEHGKELFVPGRVVYPEEGFYEILFYSTDKKKLLSRDLFWLIDHGESPFDVCIVQRKDKTIGGKNGSNGLSLKLNIAYQGKKYSGDILCSLFCQACGKQIDGMRVHSENGEIELELEPLGHIGEYLCLLSLPTTKEKSYWFTISNDDRTGQCPGNLTIIAPEAADTGDSVILRLKSNTYQSGILLIGDDSANLHDLIYRDFLSGKTSSAQSSLGWLNHQVRRGDMPLRESPTNDTLHYKLIDLNNSIDYEITLKGHYRTRGWDIFFIAFGNDDPEVSTAHIKARAGICVDFPKRIIKGDNITIPVYFSTRHGGEIFVERGNDVIMEKAITSEGVEYFEIDDSAAQYSITLNDDGHRKTLSQSYQSTDFLPKKKSFKFMFAGDESDIVDATIYPLPEPFIYNVARGLLDYPFGCAEQTSAKLYALYILYKYRKEGHGEDDIDSILRRMEMGLKRLDLFYKDGLFSLWEKGQHSIHVTIKVLETLSRIGSIPFPEKSRLIDGSVKRLKDEGVKDNRLLKIDNYFYEKHISCVEDALGIYVGNPGDRERQEAIEYISNHLYRNNEYYFWKGVKSWGGDREALFFSLMMLLRAGVETLPVRHLRKEKEIMRGLLGELWQKIMKYFSLIGFEQGGKDNAIIENIPTTQILRSCTGYSTEGVLGSTSTTISYLELLLELKKIWDIPAIEIEGHGIGKPGVEKLRDAHLKVKSGNLVVMGDYHPRPVWAPKNPVSFMIYTSKRSLRLRERGKLMINMAKAEDRSTLLADIFISGNLGFDNIPGGYTLYGQKLVVPIDKINSGVNIRGIRKGRGSINVTIRDMYNSDRSKFSRIEGFRVY